MNRVITIFTILITLILGFKSFAVGINPVYQQTLKSNEFSIKIDPHSDLFNPMLSTSEVIVDYAHELIHVTLNQKTICDMNQMCLAVVPAPIKVIFQLVDISTDECGIVKYKAALETENGLNLMEITNHQNNRCASPDFLAHETAISIVILSEATSERLAKLQ